MKTLTSLKVSREKIEKTSPQIKVRNRREKGGLEMGDWRKYRSCFAVVFLEKLVDK